MHDLTHDQNVHKCFKKCINQYTLLCKQHTAYWRFSFVQVISHMLLLRLFKKTSQDHISPDIFWVVFHPYHSNDTVLVVCVVLE